MSGHGDQIEMYSGGRKMKKQRVVRGGRSEAEKAVMRGRNLLIKAGYDEYWKHVLTNGAPQIDEDAMRSPHYCVLGRVFRQNTAMQDGFGIGIVELATVPGAHLDGDWTDTLDAPYYGFDRVLNVADYDALADAWVAQALRDKARATRDTRNGVYPDKHGNLLSASPIGEGQRSRDE